MSLYVPDVGLQRVETNVSTTTSEPGTLVTASGSIHTKGSYSELITSTAYASYGISICVSNTAVASTRSGVLCDIAIGGAGSETIIINNLMAGNQGTTGGAQGAGSMYFFPIYIPAATRISARCQAFTASDTVNIGVWLHQNPIGPGGWYGTRVTTYGADTATSSGVSISPGNGSYTTGTIIASSTNPVKYLQLGTDLLTNAAGTNLRGLAQILAASQIIANHLPFNESTTLESVHYSNINMILSKMSFNLPSAINLSVGAMRNGTAATRGWVLYGVD